MDALFIEIANKKRFKRDEDVSNNNYLENEHTVAGESTCSSVMKEFILSQSRINETIIGEDISSELSTNPKLSYIGEENKLEKSRRKTQAKKVKFFGEDPDNVGIKRIGFYDIGNNIKMKTDEEQTFSISLGSPIRKIF